MGLLALDLAKRTGWAAWTEGDTRPRFGHFDMPSAGEDIGRYLMSFHDQLSALIKMWRPDFVVYESPWVGNNPKTAAILMAQAGHTEFCARWHGIGRYLQADPSTVRKHFLGSARGKRADIKPLVIAECHRRGWAVSVDDEADACALLVFAAHYLRLQTPFPIAPAPKVEAA